MLNKLLKGLQDKNVESISGMDATFLYTETPTSPMHVGSVAVIEGALDFATFRNRIRSRIHMVPKLRKRLVYVPMSIDYPYWVDDPNFDIDMHINHIKLPGKGDWKALRQVASSIFSEHLDQSRPLWSFTFVEGLDHIPQVKKGSVAVISKIHHVAIDGAGGAGILGLIFDMSPIKTEFKEPKPFNPAPIPNELAMVLKSTMSFAQNPLKFPKLLSEVFTATFKSGVLSRAQRADLPTAPFTAPATPINGLVAARRKWNTAILSLDRIKVLKKKMGTTINDVILAICAGALRRYLLEKNKLPKKPLVAMVPISTRGSGIESSGNNISSMLVQLATNIENPIERLEVIQENTDRGKTYNGAVGAKTLSKMAEAVPFGVANQAARLYSRFHVSELHNPVFNVTITNVPGPQFPLYLEGHKLLSIMGMAPVIDGMGLIITVLSYDGHVTISPTSDVKSMPDLDTFTVYLREAANELEAAILNHDKKEAKKAKPKPKKAKSDGLMAHIKKFLKANPDLMRPDSGLFQFDVTGDVPTSWRIDLNASPASIRKGKAKDPDATLTVKDEHLVKLGMGKMSMQAAFIQGRLKLDGDLNKAMAIGVVLKKMPQWEG